MHMYRFVIVDDEAHAIEGLKVYMEHLPDFNLMATYTDPVLALKELSCGSDVELIFMDVDMPHLSGIELASIIRQKTNKLILTTAHTKYGYQAFEVKADGYLLKPYSLGKFLETMQRVFPDSIKKAEPVAPQVLENFFFVKSKEDSLKLVKIRFEEVVAVESKLNYVQLRLENGRNVTTYMSLSEISKWLVEARGFIQFQRSFILNREKIDAVDGNTVIMDNGQKITVGDYYRKDFNEFINRYLIKPRRRVDKPTPE